jgi:hypothetical protein
VSDEARARVGAAVPVVDRKGRLQVLYEDFKDDRRDFENLEGPPYEGTFALVLATSTDGGDRFSRGTEVESGIVPGRRFFAFLPEFPGFAAGPGDSLDVAWADARAGSDDVWFRHSGDAGRSWSGARRVNDNPVKDGTSQYLPRLAVARDGRVDVLFLDRRRDKARNVMTDVYLATSSDGTSSFDSVRVSDRSFDSSVGPEISPAFGVDLGTRLGLIDEGRTAVAVWTDTRFGTQTTGRQDIVGAAVQLPASVPLLARAPVVVTLVVLGLAALIAWRLRMRGAAGGEPPGEPAGEGPTDEPPGVETLPDAPDQEGAGSGGDDEPELVEAEARDPETIGSDST